jgi:hypothetical protein
MPDDHVPRAGPAATISPHAGSVANEVRHIVHGYLLEIALAVVNPDAGPGSLSVVDPGYPSVIGRVPDSRIPRKKREAAQAFATAWVSERYANDVRAIEQATKRLFARIVADLETA